MKKFLVTGTLAITALAVSYQQAWAWKSCKFSVGLNWSCQTGGNCFLWGAYRSGQPGGGDWECHRSCGWSNGGGFNGGFNGGYGGMMFPTENSFPSAPTFTPPTPTPVSQNPFWFGNPDFQNASYTPNLDFLDMLR